MHQFVYNCPFLVLNFRCRLFYSQKDNLEINFQLSSISKNKMLGYEQAQTLNITPIPENKLTNSSFIDKEPLWSKNQHETIPTHKLALCKRYIYSKMGRMLGIEIIRYLSIYQNYLFYYQQDQGEYKGYCNLKNRYVQFHKTSTGKYLLVISNMKETSVFYFQGMEFWNESKNQISQYSIGTNYMQQYKEKFILGEGSFSTVVAVSSYHDGKLYAAKKIPKIDRNHKTTKKIVMEERKILLALEDCKQISRLVEFYEQNNEFILILEYLQGKNLSDFLTEQQNMNTWAMKKILSEILTALKVLHSRDIMHRDIKPQNIVIDEDFNCKIIDFGLSLQMNEIHEKSKFSKCGTVGYMAPEVIINKHSSIRPYSNKCDIFSFGIVAHIILMGSNPLKGKNYIETYDLNLECRIVLNKSKIISKYGLECLQFIQRVLEPNPKIRYSACQALDCLFLANQEKDQNCTFQNSTGQEIRKLSEQLTIQK